ncbi:hypothetical protein KO528_09760 [Saccharophagus degradans]|uniref:DUF6544 family protein n=1 Tax=Saccharophagus degradans TaxID=86304 RepID=UPI001C09C6A1|nr:DUF6544 family protein [Saccharophagus degradans]MBU2985634.1 hypothetical protein [Saccharophagus degradans]
MTRLALRYLLLSVLILSGCSQTTQFEQSHTSDKGTTTLPSNVQRWLAESLPSEPITNKPAMLEQKGEIYVRDKWLPFNASSRYSKNLENFQWDASIKVAFGVWVNAEDGHNQSEGWGGAKMWGVIPLGGLRGKQVHQMQVSRSLAELAWNPQIVQTTSGITWANTGPSSFSATKKIGEDSVTVNFELNQANEVIRAAGNRFIEVDDTFKEMQWDYKFANHTAINGIKIPLNAVATYYKPEGPWEYFRVTITSN